MYKRVVLFFWLIGCSVMIRGLLSVSVVSSLFSVLISRTRFIGCLISLVRFSVCDNIL